MSGSLQLQRTPSAAANDDDKYQGLLVRLRVEKVVDLFARCTVNVVACEARMALTPSLLQIEHLQLKRELAAKAEEAKL